MNDKQIAKIAKAIDDGTFNNESWDGSFANKLKVQLRKLGWKPTTSSSTCTAASSEYFLKNNSRTVEIITANCMGTFTQISVSRS